MKLVLSQIQSVGMYQKLPHKNRNTVEQIVLEGDLRLKFQRMLKKELENKRNLLRIMIDNILGSQKKHSKRKYKLNR